MTNTDLNPVNWNWTDGEGDHQGGVSTGIGFTIAWQRGPLNVAGRNGAFLIEVLESCRSQIEYFQGSKFACNENLEALENVNRAMDALRKRRDRRSEAGILGTTQVDP